MSKESATRPAGRVCPPPPPKIGPLCQIEPEREKDSDLSSVSDLEEDFDNDNDNDVSKTDSQKFEEVSESELEISEDDHHHHHQQQQQHQQTSLREDLETIESDENDQTSLSSISDNEEFTDWDQNRCDICLLVFKNAEAHAQHGTSSGHLHQAKRDSEKNSPSTLCRLCSKEFQTLQELQQHEDGEEHQQEMNAKQVLSCNARLPMNGRPPKRKSVSQYTSPQKKIALGKYRSSPERVDDSLACYLCNLVFVSRAFQQKHLSSENHRKNLQSLKPPVCESWYSYFTTGHHYCYSCWIGYNNVKDLIKHYTRPSHLNLLKSLGISRIYLDERYVHKSIWHSADKFRHQTIDLKNFTVIDRVGVCDTSSETYDVGFMGQVKPASFSKSAAESLVADTEAVSSDETSDISDSELDNSLDKPSNHHRGEVIASSQLDLQDVSD